MALESDDTGTLEKQLYSLDEALKQIGSNDYAGKYKADSRVIIKVGCSFSSEKRNIAEWKNVQIFGQRQKRL